jgi:HD-GYP domain-containing protein (c-di-GMP phosphodiesterase class II)
MPSVNGKITQSNTNRLALLDKIWNKVRPEEKEDRIIACLMRMAHNVLSASAASLLLLDDKRQELYFRFANGPVGQKLKRLHIARQSGIAGWILQNSKPVVVNNPEKNANFYKLIDNATGFKTRSIVGAPIIIGGKVVGVIEVLNKVNGTAFTQHDMNVLTDVATTTAMTIESSRMNVDLLTSYKGTVRALVSLADAKETSGGGHSRRVAEYALMGANELALSKEAKLNIEYAAILHDIGKLGVSDEILNKADDLSDKEWEMIRQHPVIGYNMLKDIPFLREASKLILYHHERYDGGGYPQGMHGEAIPLGARLIAVADAFDNMTTEHSYRHALSQQEAFTELTNNVRDQFCPVAVKAFNAGFVRTRLRKTSGPPAPTLPKF